MDICVDLLLFCGDTVPEYKQKEKMIDDYKLTMGGSCGIFACQAAKLGLRTAGVGAAGDDHFGRFVLDTLNRAGVDTEHIRSDPSVKTGLGALLCLKDGDRAILTYSGSIDSVSPGDLEKLLPLTRHLHISSFYLMKKLRRGYPGLLKKAKDLGVTVSLDTNWDPDERRDGVSEVLGMTDLFLPNEREALAITGAASLDAALESLSKKVPVAAVKMGVDGAIARAGGQTYASPAFPFGVIDAVGAGDCFDAGFVYGFLNDLPIERCLRIGCYCGGRSLTAAGGTDGQCGIGDVRDLLSDDGEKDDANG